MMDSDIQRLIAGLAGSVQLFHERFGLVGPTSQEELLSRIPIQEEEVRELHQAVLYETPQRVANEAVDVLYVAIGTVLRLDRGLASAALEEVIAKNNAKSWDTHHVNEAGKVAPRVSGGRALGLPAHPESVEGNKREIHASHARAGGHPEAVDSRLLGSDGSPSPLRAHRPCALIDPP